MNEEKRKADDLKERSRIEEETKAGLWRPVLLIGLVLTVIILSRVLGVSEYIRGLRGWIEDLGAWGYVVFALLYIAATVAALPGLALTLIAGLIFGAWSGTILVSISSTIGASLAFIIGRYFARRAIEQWLSSNAKFRKLDRMTEKHGAEIVAITRLIPLFPFNLLNYGFGLTRVNFW